MVGEQTAVYSSGIHTESFKKKASQTRRKMPLFFRTKIVEVCTEFKKNILMFFRKHQDIFLKTSARI